MKNPYELYANKGMMKAQLIRLICAVSKTKQYTTSAMAERYGTSNAPNETGSIAAGPLPGSFQPVSAADPYFFQSKSISLCLELLRVTRLFSSASTISMDFDLTTPVPNKIK